ncbi:hypothetical protein [Streptomyces sp. NPDC059278]|uniref:hypothetical protein n=1 Tax=Streptomyces sp. NPDC059278 TaxID=3346801 RepID=UPI00368621FE
MQIPGRPAEGLFEMLANGTEYEDEVEIVDQPAQEVRRAYASVLATWLYGEEPKQAHRSEIDALTARAEQAEAAIARVLSPAGIRAAADAITDEALTHLGRDLGTIHVERIAEAGLRAALDQPQQPTTTEA